MQIRNRHRFRGFCITLLLLGLSLPSALAQTPEAGAGILHGTDGSMVHETADPHVRLTPTRSPSPAELATAAALADQIRNAIAQYADISLAEADGYVPFPPDPSELHIVHYVNIWRSFLERWRLDPALPGSLLYERQPDGSLQLLGAMYTAPADTTEAELHERLPLSITRWHLHTNLCVPRPIWDAEQWAIEDQGLPRFGPESAIATEAACNAVGGDFHATMFGWMVHANVFADNPADVWNPMYGHAEP